jgi:uncharacterized protein YecE (DUF72 family)
VGTAGWTNPSHQKANRQAGATHLQHYATCFNCAEINSSFYRTHRRATYEHWADSTPPNFRFSVKVPKAISHDAALRCQPEQIDDFLEGAHALGPKLAVLLIQLPPRAEFQPRAARRFFKLLTERTQVGVVCEPRHPSWSAATADRLLREFDISFVCADPPRVPHAWDSAGPILYHRLHGSPRTYWSGYSEQYLRGLASQLTDEHQRIDRVWCVFDNTAAGAAWSNAESLRQYLHTPDRSVALGAAADRPVRL